MSRYYNYYKIHQLNGNDLCGSFTSDILEQTLYVTVMQIVDNLKLIQIVSNNVKQNLEQILSQFTIRELKMIDIERGQHIVVDEYSLSYSYEHQSILLSSKYYTHTVGFDGYKLVVAMSELNKILCGTNKSSDVCKPQQTQQQNKPAQTQQHNKPQQNIKQEIKKNVYDISIPSVISSDVAKSIIPAKEKEKEQQEPENVDEIDKKLNILCDKMEKLHDARDEQTDNIFAMKDSIDKQRDKLDDYVLDNITEEKHKLRREEEKKEADRKVFKHDKKVYRLIKKDIDNGKINEDGLPVLFESKYPIFEFMDSNDMIVLNDEHDEEEFTLYREFYDDAYPEIKEAEQNKHSGYVPHNLHYLPEEEQKKYEGIKERQTDVIDEFIQKNTQKPLKTQNYIQEEDSSSEHDESTFVDSDNDSESQPPKLENVFEQTTRPKQNIEKIYASVDDILNQVDNMGDNTKISLSKSTQQLIEPLDESADLNFASVQNIKSDKSRSSLAKALDK